MLRKMEVQGDPVEPVFLILMFLDVFLDEISWTKMSPKGDFPKFFDFENCSTSSSTFFWVRKSIFHSYSWGNSAKNELIHRVR